MPAPNTDGSPNVGLQLWVDLPKELKYVEPRYRDLLAKEIPSVDLDDGKVHVKVISGQSHGVDSVKELAYTPVWLLDIEIKPGGKIEQPLPVNWSAFAYSLEGTVTFGEGSAAKTIPQYHNTVFEQKGDKIVASVEEGAPGPARFVLVAGLPHDHKVCFPTLFGCISDTNDGSDDTIRAIRMLYGGRSVPGAHGLSIASKRLRTCQGLVQRDREEYGALRGANGHSRISGKLILEFETYKTMSGSMWGKKWSPRRICSMGSIT